MKVIGADLKMMFKYADNKKAIWLLWDGVYREASLKAVKDDDVDWNDKAHSALNTLMEYVLKPKG